MTKNKKKEPREFESLQEMGFELTGSQDEFSDQPDSGGVIGGTRGQQEYGINTSVDAQGASSEKRQTERTTRAALSGSAVPLELLESPLDEKIERREFEETLKFTDPQLERVINDRLSHHPHLKQFTLKVKVESAEVSIGGTVTADSAKLLIDEIIEALPGISRIHNKVQVEIPHAP